MKRLPQITVFFWIMKVCATILGGTAGNHLSMTLHAWFDISSLLLFHVFIFAVVFQSDSTKFKPLRYWAVILSASAAGTTMADYMAQTLRIGYAGGSLIAGIIFLCIFAYWKATEGSVSVGKIHTFSEELLYWLAILFSSVLGAAFSDYLDNESGLGFSGVALLIGTLLAAVVVALYFTRISRGVLFWSAFILTHPLGAIMGAIIAKPKDRGGLGFGTIESSVTLAAILMVFILITSRKESRPADLISAAKS